MKKTMSVRIEEVLLEKLRLIAEEGGRSVNGHVFTLIRQNIEEYEKEKKRENPPEKKGL